MSPDPPARVLAAAGDCSITLGDLDMHLLADRAVHVPSLSTLLLADLHLGKGDVFRRAGIALPRGGTAGDLGRLSALIDRHRPSRVIVLGDLLHGPLPEDASWRRQWREFLVRHAGLDFAAVLGNHDRALRTQVEFDGMRLLPEGDALGGLQLRHEPPAAQLTNTAPVLCGHLHPVVRLRQPGLPSRVPVFWRSGDRLVLPAFSAFTGGFPVQPKRGCAVWLCLDGVPAPVPMLG